ncbi:hypothetical protein KJ639_00230 [Patescibacteria group bacterium]|nr:hypothetical protein [Patescibacteria group bacterium]
MRKSEEQLTREWEKEILDNMLRDGNERRDEEKPGLKQGELVRTTIFPYGGCGECAYEYSYDHPGTEMIVREKKDGTGVETVVVLEDRMGKVDGDDDRKRMEICLADAKKLLEMRKRELEKRLSEVNEAIAKI